MFKDFEIISWDGINPDTINYISLEYALKNGIVEAYENDFLPCNEDIIIRAFYRL